MIDIFHGKHLDESTGLIVGKIASMSNNESCQTVGMVYSSCSDIVVNDSFQFILIKKSD